MLRSSPLRHSFSYSLYSLRGYGTRPYTTREAHQVLAAPSLHVREVRPMVALYRSSFDFGRRSYYLAADITRVIICNMAFLDYSFARPLLFTSGLHTASSGFVLRMLLTTSLLGQAISTRSETGRTPLHRALGKCPILLLPLLLTIGVSLIAEGDPYTYPQQPGAATAEVVWHAFWLAVTSLFWLSAYRRMKKNDLKYQYALNPKSV